MRAPQACDTGSSPVRVTDTAKWRNRYTRDAQNVVSGTDPPKVDWSGHASSTLALATRFCRGAGTQPAFMRPVCPVRYRDLQLTAGGPVLIRAGHRSAEGGLVSLNGRVRPPDPLLNNGRVCKLAKRSPTNAARRCPERGDFAGSTPASVTDMIPWSSGEDTWMTPRRSVVRFYPGSL